MGGMTYSTNYILKMFIDAVRLLNGSHHYQVPSNSFLGTRHQDDVRIQLGCLKNGIVHIAFCFNQFWIPAFTNFEWVSAQQLTNDNVAKVM